MKFTQIQSLSEITLLKVAVEVCNNFEDCIPNKQDKTETMHWVYNHWEYHLCDKCLNKIKEMASHLKLPKGLENKVAALCKHVYLQMCIWYNSLVEIHSLLVPDYVPRCSCLDQVDFRQYYEWKSIGIIDEKKTVKNLLDDDRLCVNFRFVMACYFCFENDVLSLWEIMPEVSKIDIRTYTCTSLPLITYWLKWLGKENLRIEINLVIRSFLGSHDMVLDRFLRNVTLLQYFLRNFFFNRRKNCLRIVASGISKCPEITRFCLFEMDEEDQQITFKENSPEVLRSFLDWPWHKHFMKLALVMLDFLEERGYFFVMWGLWGKITCQWRDYDYIGLLTEFWNHSPTHLKEYMRREQKVFMERMISCLKKNYNFHDFH